MRKSPPNDPEVLPGAIPETDCILPETAQAAPDAASPPWRPARAAVLLWAERFSLAFERLVTGVVRNQRLNPLYHTGTIAVFLWILVAASGLYLTMFYAYGFEVSYRAMLKIDASFMGRTIRTLHNYGSGMAMLVSLLHGWRLFFMDRFRGPRWLAWVTGVLMVLVLWLDGVMGYWLVWDERSQIITLSVARFLELVSPFAPDFVFSLLQTSRDGTSWVFMITVWGLHTLLFVLVAGAFWYHIVRLSRPRFLPSGFWMAASALALVIVSVVFPLRMLPRASFEQFVNTIRLDLIYLWYIPLQDVRSPAWLWLGVALLTAGLSLLPWLVRKTPAGSLIHIDKNRCTGCTKCSLDCPYKAIQMQPRSDGKRHKYVAVENPALCVGCGVCVGSCDVLAVSVGSLTQEGIWRAVETRLKHAREENLAPRVVFTCERHALGGASASQPGGEAVSVIALPCVAAAAPNLISRTLDAGAYAVSVVGCPPDDCARREGNLWEELRLKRKRLPKLKRPYEKAAISTYWAAPDQFKQVIAQPAAGETARKWQMFPALRWYEFIPAGLLLLAAFILQVGLNSFDYRHPWENQAVLQLALPVPLQVFARSGEPPAAEHDNLPLRLVLDVDGQEMFAAAYTPEAILGGQAQAIGEFIPLPPGEHDIRLAFVGANQVLVLYQGQADLKPGQIFIIEDQTYTGYPDRRGDHVPFR